MRGCPQVPKIFFRQALMFELRCVIIGELTDQGSHDLHTGLDKRTKEFNRNTITCKKTSEQRKQNFDMTFQNIDSFILTLILTYYNPKKTGNNLERVS